MMLETCACTSFKLKSHKHQTLKEHLEGVTEIALLEYDSQFTNPVKREVIRKMCMAHDLGKATTYFQNYLDAETNPNSIFKDKVFGPEKNHALISALFAYWWVPEEFKASVFLAIKRHHGYLKNVRVEYDFDKDFEVLQAQIENIKKNSQVELENIYGFKLDPFFKFVTEDNLRKLKDIYDDAFDGDGFTIEDILQFNYFYSLLLTADKTQLMIGKIDVPVHFDCKIVENYKNRIRAKALEDNPHIAHSKIFQVRDEIFEELKFELAGVHIRSESFYSINVPTGSGKTFLSYYTVLYLAEEFQKAYEKQARIIYALPFMSIIDQNCEELMNIIKDGTDSEEEPADNVVLKHHSLTEIEYKPEEFAVPDEKFYYDNWQSGIIVTTFVQILNTIFKVGDKSIAHRFNRLVNSIIVLDEVQAIDAKYYPVMCEMIKILARDYNVKFIFVTATMPALLPVRELIPKKEEYFDCLNRIVMVNHIVDMNFSDFVDVAANDVNKRQGKSFLFVMNTIRSSKALCEHLRENTNRECIYLSTEIHPEARLEKIREIKYKIKHSKIKPIVVSTQLIEAGVDIDMDVVYRDFAPLSSLIQTAGRCRRNGLGEIQGEVHIYRLRDEKDRYFTSIYPAFALEITRSILGQQETIQESGIYYLSFDYAEQIREQISPDRSETMFGHIRNFDAESLRNAFQLIPDSSAFKRDIYIVDDGCNKILDDIRNFKSDDDNKWEDRLRLQNLFRRLNVYRISLYMSTYNLVAPDLQRIEAYDIEYLPLKVGGREVYSIDRGIIIENLSVFNAGEE